MRHSIKRKFVFFILIVCLVFSPLSVFANGQNGPTNPTDTTDDMPPCDYQDRDDAQDNWLIRRELPSRQMGLNILGDMSQLTSSFGESYDTINQRINDITDELISEARRARARSITFSYERIISPDMASILIRASVSSAIYRTLVRSVNFCLHTGEFLTIRDVGNFDVVPLANRILEERVRRAPENFYAVSSVSLDNQAFFADCYGITILFDEFQLSSTVSGVFYLELKYENIRTVAISPDQLLPNDNAYNLMMVPLSYVAGGLGYSALRRQPGGANIFFASGSDIRLLAWLYQDINEYHTQDMTMALEAPPHNRNDRIYVPITFFDHILPLTVYSIDSFGNITFLAYFV